MEPKAKKERNLDKVKDFFIAKLAFFNQLEAPGFSYSFSVHEAKNKHKWKDGNLDKWLTKPSGSDPGNEMGFAENDRKRED